MQPLRKLFLAIAALGLLILLAGLLLHRPDLWQPAAITAATSLALGIAAVASLRTYQFTLWIIAAVAAAMLYPNAFQHWGNLNLRNPWLILLIVQAVMFGMGTQMSLHDFAGVARQPLGVLVGIVCHFSVMPLVGFALTKLFHFPPEIAAGIILIGSCSSGLASNVMAYIARANIALSVTVTAITTMIAPLMTPLWMKLLAGQLVEVHFLNMMVEIIQIVLVPIAAALIHDYLKHASRNGRILILILALIGAAWLTFLPLGGWNIITANASPNARLALSLLGLLLAAPLFGLIYHAFTRLLPKLDHYTPIASMFGIVYFTLVTTAAGRDNLLQVGALLFVASILHNAAGYFFGYFLSRAARLDKNSARSVAFEVGLQNGGMATGLASAMGKLATVGLAPAIFSPWMNISGSLLANYWRRRPAPTPQPTPTQPLTTPQ
ncbi:MAG: bile acid:sodium symporter family protein [Phycisphaerae bacterium]